ncbi:MULTISPECIES: MFS transporter [Vagococcus]|uniref:Major facilitator superfamily transporter-permease n=1 Tax=Vagococcus fluvialis bH819 TaxID=1255619 RepID=A0A1X6WL52_9ENTE|nr:MULTISPECIES: MFS transporter [Vagococcus]SLM84998.1 Major facilitator superfamily transporter-permease [Vagococcus fluvialis bH819]HCM88585.1 MFS transporter [Vagococcus sp.]
MNKNSFLFKASLLSISSVLVAGPVISSLIPLMHESFPSQSMSSIELIATVPNFGILIFVLLSNFIIKFIGKKNTVLLGLAIALISGLIPVFIDNYTVILVSRFFFGAGIGLFNALAVSLITELYDGEQQASLMGLQAAMGSIGSTVMTLLVGYFTRFGWQNSFLVYAISVLPLIMFALFIKLPSDEKSEEFNDNQTQKTKESVNAPTLVLMLFALIVYALFFVVMLKTATLLVETGLGKPETAASILGSITIVGIVVGVFYGKIFKLLKQNVLPIGLLGMGLGFIIILSSSSISMVTAGAIVSGLSFSLAAPFMFMLVGQVAPKNSANLATGILLVGINLGVFLSPTIHGFLGKMTGMTTAADSFLISGLGLIGLSVLSFVVLSLQKKKQLAPNT